MKLIEHPETDKQLLARVRKDIEAGAIAQAERVTLLIKSDAIRKKAPRSASSFFSRERISTNVIINWG